MFPLVRQSSGALRERVRKAIGLDSNSSPSPWKLVVAGSNFESRQVAEGLQTKTGAMLVTLTSVVEAEMQKQTEAGKLAAEFIASKQNLPPMLITGLLKKRLAEGECCTKGWIIHDINVDTNLLGLFGQFGVRPEAILLVDEDKTVCDELTAVDNGKAILISSEQSPNDVIDILRPQPKQRRLSKRTSSQTLIRVDEDNAQADTLNSPHAPSVSAKSASLVQFVFAGDMAHCVDENSPPSECPPCQSTRTIHSTTSIS